MFNGDRILVFEDDKFRDWLYDSVNAVNTPVLYTLKCKMIDSMLCEIYIGDCKEKATQSCPTLCNPMDYTVHGILQARILEWVAVPFSGGPSQPMVCYLYFTTIKCFKVGCYFQYYIFLANGWVSVLPKTSRCDTE